MSFKYTILTSILLFFAVILHAQNYNSMTVEELTRLKDEAVKNEQFEKAAEIKKVLDERGMLNSTLTTEPYAELSISVALMYNLHFDVIIEDVYVGTISPKNLMIHINKVPEGRANIKFISINNKFEFEKNIEVEKGESYALQIVSLNTKNKAPARLVQNQLSAMNAEELKGKKGSLYIKFDNNKTEILQNATVHEDLDNISFPPAGMFGATKSYWYLETTTNGFNKKKGYSYNNSFGAKQPFLKYPNSGVIWGLEMNVWFSEDLFPDGSGEYSGIPTSVSLNYILGLQYELTDFIIIYSTGSIGPALTETTKITSADDGFGFPVTEEKWGVGVDSSADLGLIITFGPNSRKGISLETNYNSHTGNSFAIGLVFGVNKVLKRHTMY